MQLVNFLALEEDSCLFRPGFNPWVRKIPWRRKWQPTPVLLPGKSHGQRSLVGYSQWGHRGILWRLLWPGRASPSAPQLPAFSPGKEQAAGVPGSPVPSTPERREGLWACYWEGPSELPSYTQERKLPGAAHLAGPALLWRELYAHCPPWRSQALLVTWLLYNSVTFSLFVLMNSACLKLPSGLIWPQIQGYTGPPTCPLPSCVRQ